MKTITTLLGMLLLTATTLLAQDIYVSGSEGDAMSPYVAKLWKNGTAQDLSDGSNDAYGMSVFVSGDVYVAGYVYNGTTGIATLWKNGVPQYLSDSSNYANAFSLFIVGQLGSEEITTKQNSLVVYPNPAQDVLQINSPQPTLLQLYSLQGQLLQEIKTGQNTQVDISNLTTGLYLLKDMNTGITQKVVKK